VLWVVIAGGALAPTSDDRVGSFLLTLLLHVDWWGEILPTAVLCAIILTFVVASGRVGKKRRGRGGGEGNRAARRALAARGRRGGQAPGKL
jgi:hypothetical protein